MNRHISEQFDEELQSARQLMMEMGGLLEQQLSNARDALFSQQSEKAMHVIETEKRINGLEKELDEHCIQIIARRQPAASDLRMMISVLRASSDLERIGDEAKRIARTALKIANQALPDDRYAEIESLMTGVEAMVARALDAFARSDVDSALANIAADADIDRRYKTITERLVQDMQRHPDTLDLSMSMIWVARALERIGDHAKNICEYVVYLARGEDVRHTRNPTANN
ncbi:MAG: phosphate signaling complex protein PhoU [Pseudomonadales bacterium]|nr:phosphate signaling complex protein PhoU [Pseudomonadales bacterium]MCP5184892.1 phosphate signaling complex protein PhoU [Pseudomonadales bacterium]